MRFPTWLSLRSLVQRYAHGAVPVDAFYLPASDGGLPSCGRHERLSGLPQSGPGAEPRGVTNKWIYIR
jgi:hypothetical protein